MAFQFQSPWSRDVIDFSAPWDMSDVCFVIEGKSIYVNKTVMSMWSPVMKASFEDEWKEKNGTDQAKPNKIPETQTLFGDDINEKNASKPNKIELPGKKYEDMLQLVKVLHPSDRDELQETTNFKALLCLAHEYKISKLIKRIEDHLTPSLDNLLLAEKLGLDSLYSKCIKHILNDTLLCETAVEMQFFDFSKKTQKQFLEKLCDAETVLSEFKDVKVGDNSTLFGFGFNSVDENASAGLTQTGERGVRNTCMRRSCNKEAPYYTDHIIGTNKSCHMCAIYHIRKNKKDNNK